jgi:repressor LexA
MALREIGDLAGEKHPQKIKHHLQQLEQKNLIEFDREAGIIKRVRPDTEPGTIFVLIPILGSANCGPATFYADENIQGYMKVSSKLVGQKSGLFAVRAVGNSMNKASIKGNNIEEGDYVIIDKQCISPQDRDYVLSVIDGICNIKRFFKDDRNEQIILLSESTQEIPPIVIHPEETNYIVNGKVIYVIKRPGL